MPATKKEWALAYVSHAVREQDCQAHAWFNRFRVWRLWSAAVGGGIIDC